MQINNVLETRMHQENNELSSNFIIRRIRQLRLHVCELILHFHQLMARFFALSRVLPRSTQCLIAFRLQDRFAPRRVLEKCNFAPQQLQVQVTSLHLVA